VGTYTIYNMQSSAVLTALGFTANVLHASTTSFYRVQQGHGMLPKVFVVQLNYIVLQCSLPRPDASILWIL
jgi:hypothetical protein